MSKYLDRLKTLNFKKHLLNQVSKVAKGSSETFETDIGKGVFENIPAFETFETGKSRYVSENQFASRTAGQVGSGQPSIVELRLEGRSETRENALPGEVSKVAKAPARFSDLWETEVDYARALIRYARQDGLSLTVKDGRLVIAIGRKSDADLLGELRKHETAVIEALAAGQSVIDAACEYHRRRIVDKEAELARLGLGPDGVTPLAEYQRLEKQGQEGREPKQ